MYKASIKRRISLTNNMGSSKAFTLIEVMVVVVIIGILAYFIVPSVINSVDDARFVKAKTEITNIKTSLSLYRIDNGIYPTTEQGLQALLTKPDSEPVPINWRRKYMEKYPMDPWSRPYQYRSPGKYDDIDIFSFGPSGENEIDESNYIGSWNLN